LFIGLCRLDLEDASCDQCAWVKFLSIYNVKTQGLNDELLSQFQLKQISYQLEDKWYEL